MLEANFPPEPSIESSTAHANVSYYTRQHDQRGIQIPD